MKVRAMGTAVELDRFVAELRRRFEVVDVSRPVSVPGGQRAGAGLCGGADLMATTSVDVVRPCAGFLGAATDDYVVRLCLPGAVVHDCTLAQARALHAELTSVIATAERAEQRDRRVRR